MVCYQLLGSSSRHLHYQQLSVSDMEHFLACQLTTLASSETFTVGSPTPWPRTLSVQSFLRKVNLLCVYDIPVTAIWLVLMAPQKSPTQCKSSFLMGRWPWVTCYPGTGSLPAQQALSMRAFLIKGASDNICLCKWGQTITVTSIPLMDQRTVQTFDSCTSRTDVCRCLAVQKNMDNMSKKMSQAHANQSFV